MRTSPLLLRSALRMRVARSAIGSVMVMARIPWAPGGSPGRLLHARDLSLERERTEAETAAAELAVVGPRAAAQVAAVVLADLELRGPPRLHPQARPSQSSLLLVCRAILPRGGRVLSSAHACWNGIPSAASSASACASSPADVTTETSMPCTVLTVSPSTSGKTVCSTMPSV